MRIREKLPLINSDKKSTQIIKYFVYALVAVTVFCGIEEGEKEEKLKEHIIQMSRDKIVILRGVGLWIRR